MNMKRIITAISALVLSVSALTIHTLADNENHTYYNTLPIEMANDGQIATTDVIDINLQRYVNNICNKSEIPVELIYSIMWRESGYTANIHNEGLNDNGTIDYGIMQINNSNFAWLQERTGLEVNEKTMMYAYTNIACGVEILKINMDYFRQQGYDGKQLLYYSLMGYGQGTSTAMDNIRNGINHDDVTDKAWNMYQYILENQEYLLID